MKIPEYRNLVRQDLLDTAVLTQVFPDESIDRAILSAVEDFSRFLPAELYYELTVTSQTWTETFNLTSLGLTAPFTITLARKPLYFNSLVITGSGNTYALNTDYTIDYTNGIISVPSTSSIVAGSTLTVTYQLSRTSFDLSSLTNLRSIQAVEILYGRVPDEFSGFTLRGTFLTVTTRGNRSQNNIPGNFHLRIAYEARHVPPDDDNDGTVYESDAEVITKGASANLLFSKAVSIEIAQATLTEDLSSLDAYFTEAETLFAGILGDMTSARNQLALASTQTAFAVTELNSVIAAVATDLADVPTKITAAEAALVQAISTATAGLIQVDTEVPTLINAGIANIDTEVNTDLGTAITIHTSTALSLSNGAAAIVTALSDIAAFSTQLGVSTTDHTAAAALLNSVNVGQNPQQDYIELAKVAASWAQADILAGEGAIKAAEAYIVQADGYVKEANSIVGIAEARLKLDEQYVASARELINLLTGYNGAAREYANVAAARIEEAKLDLESAKTRIQLVTEAVSVAEQYVHIAGGFHQGYVGIAETGVQAVGQKVALIQAGIQKAAELRAHQEFLVKTAEILRTEATRRYEDFKVMISDRNQIRRSGTIVATTQLG